MAQAKRPYTFHTLYFLRFKFHVSSFKCQISSVKFRCMHCMSTFEGRDVLLESESNFILFVCFSFGLDLPIPTFHFRFWSRRACVRHPWWRTKRSWPLFSPTFFFFSFFFLLRLLLFTHFGESPVRENLFPPIFWHN